jgi:CDP-diacylglycerol--serine O-phosphatidyltransferase
MKASRRPITRPNMRRAVILFPSGLTLGNLFFGVFAIIAASRLEFTTAGVYVMLGGICDALDGRVARATNAGTQFGEELDSLVDAITFGLAPAMIMYFAVLNHDGWDWIFVFLFAAAAVLRLARFNIEQAGTAKTYFQGLPSPAAGITLASYYWFSQSWLYDYGAIGNLKWHVLLRYLMAVLAFLMISNVPYPNFPRTGFRSFKSAGASLVLLASAVLFLFVHRLEFFFPMALVYVAWGLFRWVFSGLFERRQPTLPYDLSDGEDEADEDVYELVPSQVHASRQHRNVEPAAKPERTTTRTERSDRSRPEREPRATRTEAAASTGSAEAESSRAGRPDRPQRTEAERAARRETREKRDKRDRSRSERPPLADGSEQDLRSLAIPGNERADLPATLAPDADENGEEQIIGVIPGGADAEALSGASGTTRKRKRRRRRGARDRGDASLSGEGSDDGAGGDDAGDEGETRSPYSAPSAPPVPEHPSPAAMSPRIDGPAEPRPYTPPLPAPAATIPAARPDSSE